MALAGHAEVTDVLVSLDESLMRVLAKFESPRFVHTFSCTTSGSNVDAGAASAGRATHIELPRFGLEFEVRGDALVSRDYAGYALAPRQQLPHTLQAFTQCLVLQQLPGVRLAVGLTSAEQLLLVPAGPVARNTSGGSPAGAVRVVVSDDCGKEIKAHRYEVHGRFSHLRTSGGEARLQLAALYAASGTLLPDPATHLTGGQQALQLLRQCWVNRPLSEREAQHLHSAARLGGHLTPALHLVAHELALSAWHVHHLHGSADAPAPWLAADAATSYVQLHRAARATDHPQSVLLRDAQTPEEERRVLGTCGAAPDAPAWARQGLFTPVEALPACPVAADAVAAAEERLTRLLRFRPPHAGGPAPPYPLQQAAGSTPLERDMHLELRQSWDAHHALPRVQIPPGNDLLGSLLQEQALASQQRQDVEQYLTTHLAAVPPSVGCHGAAFRLLRAGGLAPTAGLLDLVRSAWQPHLLRAFNPFLSDKAHHQLQQAVSLWLQLCVLEDRLERITTLARGGSEWTPLLVQELQVRREWDVRRHPQWLAFEVEGRLQIRPVQYRVARHLMDNPGAIVQLNMGEGKTRVILPMLALHWADGTRLVRLNLLSTLLDEAFDHLHQHLCASVLGRRIFTLPFHRDVQLTVQQAQAMHTCLNYCQQVGGLLLVAPEHRLSLQLKWHELRTKGDDATCRALDGLASLPFVDVLDESDELLHHRYQLIYACGSSAALPALEARVHATQALLQAVSRHAQRHHAQLVRDGLADFTAIRKPGAFSGVRLLPGAALDAALPTLQLEWASALVDDPPFNLRWMRDHADNQERLLRCMTDVSLSADEHLGELELTDTQRHHLLALRGLLACHVLPHSLQKRHGVTYGVNTSPTARKRLAVPFRAAETPAERSEYAQPDVALVLTTLSYACTGLSRDQFSEALKELMRLGGPARARHYDEWLEHADLASWPDVTQETRVALDSADKLDPTNAHQVAALHQLMSHNLPCVCFWLEHCVLPTETKQFPQRLVCSAWHLADNPRGAVVGFSGTNDNHRLLPLLVRQHIAEVDDRSLLATNGKMLDVLLANPSYTTLAAPAEDAPPTGADAPGARLPPQQRALLDLCATGEVHALVDCGALLAGVSNSDAALYLLARLAGKRDQFQGVCFFDTRARQWVVQDFNGRCAPRHTSPVTPRDAFVIYDEARCRGSDLVLRPQAVGLVTLAQGVCKDKLMQAAGRLRQLGRGQMLRFVGPRDVTAKILTVAGGRTPAPQPAALTSRDVLQWVMRNTVQATLHGVVAWAGQGLHFATTKGLPDRRHLEEVLELEQLYGQARRLQDVGPVVAGSTRANLQRCGEERVEGAMRRLVDAVCGLSAVIGAGHRVVTGPQAEEECERELEQEEEEEAEEERELPRVQVADEADWSYASALAATSVQQLPADAHIQPLGQAVSQLLQPASLHELYWDGRVFCTSNFLRATSLPAGGAAGGSAAAAANEYMRAVDSLLLFPAAGQVLLVSEREAEGLLEAVWDGFSTQGRAARISSPGASTPLLLSLCFTQLAATSGVAPLLAVALSASAPALAPQQPVRVPVEALVSSLLFNGQTTFRSGRGRPQRRWEAAQQHLRRVVRGRREACVELVSMRGKQVALPSSDLAVAAE